jgi:signal transduction histidine kinase
MSGATPDPAAESGVVSRRWLWPWHAYLAVCAVVMVVLVARDTGTGPTAREVALTCLVLIAASWAVVGARTAHDDTVDAPDTTGARWYILVVGVLFAAAVAADGIATYALFALCSMAFLCLSLRPALVAVALLNLAPVPVTIIRDGSGARLGAVIGIGLLGLTFAALIGTSIDRIARQSADRARLIAALEASRAEVAAFSHEAGTNAERARLAAEIHDTLAQGFTSIVTLIQAAESEVDSDRGAADRHLALALRTARENLAEARAMVTVLTPADLRAGTLADLVGRQVARLVEETGASASCAVAGIPADLPTAVEVVLVRAVQQSLTNVRTHAHATTVTVDLIGATDTVTLTVTDDGAGFDPTRPTDGDGPRGYGLRGMRARAEQVGGTLTIRSAPGLGTTLTLELPT